MQILLYLRDFIVPLVIFGDCRLWTVNESSGIRYVY